MAEEMVAPTWLPFQLHPEIGPEGMRRDQYFPAARLSQIDSNLQRMADEVGLTMKPPERLINTRLALATAEFAREKGLHDPVHRALFKEYWEGTADLSDPIHLSRIATEAGLDGEELLAALRDGRYDALLDEHRVQAGGIGVNAIPAHVFGRRFLVIGAHPYELLKQVVERIGADQASA